MVVRRSVGEIIFDTLNILFMVLLGFTTLYPFINVAVTSISLPGEANAMGLHLFTANPSFYAYEKIFQNQYLMTGFRNSVIRTVLGTAINVVLSCLVAYPLSKKYLPLRNLWTSLIVFTMFFSGGLIPSYLLVKSLGLLNSLWALILPGAIGTYSMIIVRNNFQALPPDLEESARIDGANDIIILFVIVLPICVPIIATITLWYAVGHWNAWFDALIYNTDESLMVLQVLLRKMIVEGSAQYMEQSGTGTIVNDAGYNPTPGVIKSAVIIVSSVPIICVYPFVQRYFMKGILVGSLKG